MSADEVNAALSNLQSIKNNEDPRSTESESTTTTFKTTPAPSQTHAIVKEMKAEARRTFEEYPFLTDHIDMYQLSFYVAEWKRRRGLCTYNQYSERDEYGSKVSKSDFDFAPGSHAIGLAKRTYEDDHNWEGTVRHEIAHAYLYNKHNESQNHNDKFKQLNERIGGSWKECSSRNNYSYAISCPNGCFKNGKHKRSKKIKRPWRYSCPKCNTKCFSHDYDEDTSGEPGSCLVESIDWNGKRQYDLHPTQTL